MAMKEMNIISRKFGGGWVLEDTISFRIFRLLTFPVVTLV